jgi:hypothetical protein
MHNHQSAPTSRSSSALLAVVLVLPALPAAQQTPGKLGIKILEGEGAINNTRQRTARENIVQVTDENNKPVAGAVVTFTLPSRGASGLFANGARSVTVLTNAQGQATAVGMVPNSVAGQVQIQVSASFQGQTASATITQTNAAVGAAASSAKTLAILGIAGGAAAGVIAAVAGGNGNPPPPPPPTPSATVTLGRPTVGAPPR